LGRFAAAVTALLAVAYVYLAARLAGGPLSAAALAAPFVFIWILPVVYWGRERGRERLVDKLVHRASYLSMAWVSFALVLCVLRDVLLGATLLPAFSSAHQVISADGPPIVLAGSVLALVCGAVAAFRGPKVEQVELRVAGLHPDLEGLRIAQISDLHVGPNIGRRYVDRVVQLCHSLKPDLVVLTGDIVDGTVARLAHAVAPLAELARGSRAFFVLGNHDCYSGPQPWIAHWRAAGYTVLLNESTIVPVRNARLLVGGVTDPAYRLLKPQISIENQKADFRLLLAHNPRLAPLGAKAGFDLQLSGHTHAGQFFPWTLAVRIVHAPHAAGLSREGRMQVYVSAGTGTWGPPVRFGTSPELTLIRLARA